MPRIADAARRKTRSGAGFRHQASDRGGISPQAAKSWLGSAPKIRNSFAADSAACQKFWRAGAKLRAQLPARATCSEAQARAVEAINARERNLRDQFLAAHAEALYGKLTNNRKNFVRVEQLVRDGAKLVPGLLPSEKELAAEAPLALKDKERIEIDQGLFLAHVLANETTGRHLCHAMLLPRADSLELLPRLLKEGSLDLGRAHGDAAGQGVGGRDAQPALPQCDGRQHPRPDRNGRRPRAPRSADRDRRAARRRGRPSEIRRPPAVLLRHQPHPSLPGQDLVPVLFQTRHGL